MKMKKQGTDQERILAKYIPKRELVPRIYSDVIQHNNKTKQFNKNWAKYLNKPFTKEDIQMANKYIKRYIIIH